MELQVQSVYRGHVARKHVDGMRAEQQHQACAEPLPCETQMHRNDIDKHTVTHA